MEYSKRSTKPSRTSDIKLKSCIHLQDFQRHFSMLAPFLSNSLSASGGASAAPGAGAPSRAALACRVVQHLGRCTVLRRPVGRPLLPQLLQLLTVPTARGPASAALCNVCCEAELREEGPLGFQLSSDERGDPGLATNGAIGRSLRTSQAPRGRSLLDQCPLLHPTLLCEHPVQKRPRCLQMALAPLAGRPAPCASPRNPTHTPRMSWA